MPSFDSITQDARYALRWFRRDLAVSGAIVLTLAFGVGLNTGVFSVLSGMIFRTRADRDPATFFQALVSPPAQPAAAPRLFAASTADFRSFSRLPGASATTAWTVSSARLQDDPNPTLALLVSCGFFSVYQLAHPAAGRFFEGAECDAPQTPPVMLIGEKLWRDRFHADDSILGRTVPFGGTEYRIVGMLPANFSGQLRGPGIWIPYAEQARFYGGLKLFQQDTRPWLTLEGRLAPRISRDQIASQLHSLLTPERALALTNGSIIEDPSSRAMAASVTVLLVGALALVLLLACTNVTMLLLSRAVARRYEMSVRLSLGATRARLLQMAATEGVLLALLAGTVGATIAAAVPAVLRAAVHGMPFYPMHTDWIVFTYLAGITLLAGCGAAMAPAAESLRLDLAGSLRRQESFVAGRWRLRELLVAAQVAMSLVLVVGAVLVARTDQRLFQADAGLDSTRVLIATIRHSASDYQALQNRLRSLDGVRSVAAATSIYWARTESTPVRLNDGRASEVALSAVTPNFFDTLGLNFLAGATLNETAPTRVVVTQAAAAELWPHADPLSQTIETNGRRYQVAGVVRESDLDRRSPMPRVFRVLTGGISGTTLLIAAQGDASKQPRQIAAALESAGVELRELPRTLDADRTEMASRFSVMARFALFFGVSAFVLALIGVYGVMAFAVQRRTREMGIRLALGASRPDIVRDVFHSAMRPMAWGLVAGLPLAAAFAILLQQAFRRTPTPLHANDPMAFAAVPVLLIIGALIAMLRPALRACAVNPAVSLRQD